MPQRLDCNPQAVALPGHVSVPPLVYVHILLKSVFKRGVGSSLNQVSLIRFPSEVPNVVRQPCKKDPEVGPSFKKATRVVAETALERAGAASIMRASVHLEAILCQVLHDVAKSSFDSLAVLMITSKNNNTGKITIITSQV